MPKGPPCPGDILKPSPILSMLQNLPHLVGRSLRDVKAGLEKTLYHAPEFSTVPAGITVTSPAFQDSEAMPMRFTADGEKLSPPVAWRGIPAAARTLILVVEDADSPTPKPITHALVLDLPPRDGHLAEGELPSPAQSDSSHPMGKNSYFGKQYLPPDPPPGHGPHRYVFQMFALDVASFVGDEPSFAQVRTAMTHHVMAKGILIGTYERP